MLVHGKKLAVFSIKKVDEKEGRTGGGSVWVRAGSAWVNKDGSMNVYLDVLPIDGKLHVREAAEKREAPRDPTPPRPVEPQPSSAFVSSEAYQ